MCILIELLDFREQVMCFFFVASKFNSEMQAMFCGRIIPSLYRGEGKGGEGMEGKGREGREGEGTIMEKISLDDADWIWIYKLLL